MQHRLFSLLRSPHKRLHTRRCPVNEVQMVSMPDKAGLASCHISSVEALDDNSRSPKLDEASQARQRVWVISSRIISTF